MGATGVRFPSTILGAGLMLAPVPSTTCVQNAFAARGPGVSAFVPLNAGTAPPMIASSKGPVSTVPPSYFTQGTSGPSGGSGSIGGSGGPGGTGGGGGDDDDKYWWIGAEPPSRGESLSMVMEFGAEGVASMYEFALRRTLEDTKIGDAERIVRLADILHEKGAGVRTILTIEDEVVRDESTDGVKAGIHGSLEARGNANLQLAAAIAVAFHGGVEEAPSPIVSGLRRGLSYPDRRVQLKTALAMLYDGSEESTALLAPNWYRLSPEVQDRAIELFAKRDEIGRPVDGVLRLHIDLASLHDSEESRPSIAVARRLLNRERFRILLARRPEIFDAVYRSYVDSFQKTFRQDSRTRKEDILYSEYMLIGAAVHVAARHPELEGSEIYRVAMDVVAGEINTVARPRGGPIREAEGRANAARAIPDDDLAIAWGKLLSHEDPLVRRNAALGMTARGLEKREI